MESESNTKLLKQYTKRERKGVKRDAIKAGAKGAKRGESVEPTAKVTKGSIFPGAKYLKKLYSSSAFSVIAFTVAAVVIVKYGNDLAEIIDAQIPTEQSIL